MNNLRDYLIQASDGQKFNNLRDYIIYIAESQGGGGTSEPINLYNNYSIRSVIEFGAKGDGSKDDTQAIQDAIDAGGLVVVPYGIYVITKTLYYRDNSVLVGVNNPVFRASLSGTFDKVAPSAHTPQWRLRETMITAINKGGRRGEVQKQTENVHIEGIVFDWQNRPTNGAHAPLLIDNTSGATIRNVNFVNCLPDGYDPEATGETPRGHCMSVSYSDDILIEHCEFTSSGYRYLGVGYDSRNVIVQNNLFYGNSPWRHSIEVHHGIDDANKVIQYGRVTIKNNKFVLANIPGGGQTDLICLHGPRNVDILHNELYVEPGASTGDFFYFIKYFDYARNITVKGNYIHGVEAFGSQPFKGRWGAIINDAVGASRNINITENKIITEYDPEDFVDNPLYDIPIIGDAVRPEEGRQGVTDLSIIEKNTVTVGENDTLKFDVTAIRSRGPLNRVATNTIEGRSYNHITAIEIMNDVKNTVTGNSISARIERGIVYEEDVTGGIVKDNVFGNISGTRLILGDNIINENNI